MTDHSVLLAQSIFPRLNCAQYRDDAAYRASIDRIVGERRAGGFVVFDGDVDTVHGVLADLQKAAGGELLFAADCEDGVTMRFPGGTEFPSMMALGSSEDVSTTYAVARSIAREMRSLGIYWNYAPVADINTNPHNPIINIRAFGATPELVSDHVHAYIQAMQDGGVMACAKHFPGHGDTATDSHRELPVLEWDRRRLDTVELAPFRTAIRNGVRSVMVAHVAAPALDPSGAPASLSEPVTRGLLRLGLGFDGVIVTDALDMHAISAAHEPGRAALMAYEAGADALCIPADPAAAHAALVEAFEAKRFRASRVKESAARIAAAKRWTAAYQDDVAHARGSWRGHDVIALEAARRSIQVSGRMRALADPTIVIAMADDAAAAKANEWLAHFARWHAAGECVVLTPEAGAALPGILERVEAAQSAVLALFVRPRGFAGSVALSPDQQAVAERALERPAVLLNFGNPYLLRDSEPNVRIDAFSACSASLAASIEALNRAVK